MSKLFTKKTIIITISLILSLLVFYWYFIIFSKINRDQWVDYDFASKNIQFNFEVESESTLTPLLSNNSVEIEKGKWATFTRLNIFDSKTHKIHEIASQQDPSFDSSSTTSFAELHILKDGSSTYMFWYKLNNFEKKKNIISKITRNGIEKIGEIDSSIREIVVNEGKVYAIQYQYDILINSITNPKIIKFENFNFTDQIPTNLAELPIVVSDKLIGITSPTDKTLNYTFEELDKFLEVGNSLKYNVPAFVYDINQTRLVYNYDSILISTPLENRKFKVELLDSKLKLVKIAELAKEPVRVFTLSDDKYLVIDDVNNPLYSIYKNEKKLNNEKRFSSRKADGTNDFEQETIISSFKSPIDNKIYVVTKLGIYIFNETTEIFDSIFQQVSWDSFIRLGYNYI
jgi:hypothetical protein